MKKIVKSEISEIKRGLEYWFRSANRVFNESVYMCMIDESLFDTSPQYEKSLSVNFEI